MDSLGITWSHLEPLDQLGEAGFHLFPFVLTWLRLVSLGLTWFKLVSLCLAVFHLGLTWIHLGSLGLILNHLIHLVSLVFTCSLLVSLGLTWCHLVSLGLVWTHMVLLGLVWVSLGHPWTHLQHSGPLGLTWTHLGGGHLRRIPVLEPAARTHALHKTPKQIQLVSSPSLRPFFLSPSLSMYVQVYITYQTLGELVRLVRPP